MININPQALLTCAPFVSTDQSRPVLQNIALLAGGLVAVTDDHVLGVYNAGHDSDTEILIAPSAALTKLAKSALKLGVNLELVTEPIPIVSAAGSNVAVELSEGPYPNIVQVFPLKQHQDVKRIPFICLNPKLLAKFGETVRLTFKGELRAITVQTEDHDFLGLIMPKRNEDISDNPCPAWFSAPEALKVAV